MTITFGCVAGWDLVVMPALSKCGELEAAGWNQYLPGCPHVSPVLDSGGITLSISLKADLHETCVIGRCERAGGFADIDWQSAPWYTDSSYLYALVILQATSVRISNGL